MKQKMQKKQIIFSTDDEPLIDKVLGEISGDKKNDKSKKSKFSIVIICSLLVVLSSLSFYYINKNIKREKDSNNFLKQTNHFLNVNSFSFDSKVDSKNSFILNLEKNYQIQIKKMYEYDSAIFLDNIFLKQIKKAQNKTKKIEEIIQNTNLKSGILIIEYQKPDEKNINQENEIMILPFVINETDEICYIIDN